MAYTYKLPAIINKRDCVFFYTDKANAKDKFSKHVFSQFYMCQFKDDLGNEYCCAEQYMMAMKAKLFDEPMFEVIMKETVPGKIKRLGRQIKNFNQAEWDKVKFNIVSTGNYYKFSQNPELRQIITATGDKYLVEAAQYDAIWGIGYNSYNAPTETRFWGQNLLGQALMKVRHQLI
jgi:ribA/ribD-fused uncharacterized protein